MKKITNDELKSLGLIQMGQSCYWYYKLWEYQFDQMSNILIYFNDGFPEDEPIARIADYNHLKQIIELINNGIL